MSAYEFAESLTIPVWTDIPFALKHWMGRPHAAPHQSHVAAH